RLVAQHLDALGQREERFLGLVDGDPDHQAIDELGGALDDVHMAVRHRIERAWIKTSALGHVVGSLRRPSSPRSLSAAANGNKAREHGFSPCSHAINSYAPSAPPPL